MPADKSRSEVYPDFLLQPSHHSGCHAMQHVAVCNRSFRVYIYYDTFTIIYLLLYIYFQGLPYRGSQWSIPALKITIRNVHNK